MSAAGEKDLDPSGAQGEYVAGIIVEDLDGNQYPV
jgi:hypothetical protein